MNYYIRPVQEGDGAGINELRRMKGVFENILGIPSERIQRSEDGIANMGANMHQFVAVCRDESDCEKIIGSAGLAVSDSARKRHSGGIGMMVHRDYQGMGVGTALLGALMDIADNWLMLQRVELNVYTDNERAIGLYKKFGFEVEGTMEKASIRNGEYTDEYMMARVK